MDDQRGHGDHLGVTYWYMDLLSQKAKQKAERKSRN